jgi:nucleotide-binding universal stress UspA family protein
VARAVIVGFDGSDHALDALALGRMLSPLVGGELLPAAVYRAGPESPHSERRELERAIAGDAVRLRQRAREHLGDGEVELSAVRASSPARGLHDLAAEREAAMIVLGSTHRGRLGRISPGSVAQRMLNGAPCPIAIAPAGLRNWELGIDSLGVAFDGSRASHHALGSAVGLARAAGARVDLIGAVHLLPGPIGRPHPFEGGSKALLDRLTADLAQRMDEAMRRVPEANRGTIEVHVGDAAKVFSARSGDLDLFVCGSRGYGLVRQVLLGGVSAHLTRQARCPLLVVPRDGKLG